jgi:hypothetical protein
MRVVLEYALGRQTIMSVDYHVTGYGFMSPDKISCHLVGYHVTGYGLMSPDKVSCQ